MLESHVNMSILLSEVHEIVICDPPLNFKDLVKNAHHRAHARQTQNAMK